jgi:hypothetical protein
MCTAITARSTLSKSIGREKSAAAGPLALHISCSSGLPNQVARLAEQEKNGVVFKNWLHHFLGCFFQEAVQRRRNWSMKNECVFSPCRSYRYTLIHRWEELFPTKAVAWIGLNPSTAQEDRLDPTLRRIKSFSAAWGFNAFCMLNLFAFRATDPQVMKCAADPIGQENDRWIVELCGQVQMVIACWGVHGGYLGRAELVAARIPESKLCCLRLTKRMAPAHPLYVPSHITPKRYVLVR